MPLPSEETTPPVTKMYLAIFDPHLFLEIREQCVNRHCSLPISTPLERASRSSPGPPGYRLRSIRTPSPPRGWDGRFRAHATAPGAPPVPTVLRVKRNIQVKNLYGKR